MLNEETNDVIYNNPSNILNSYWTLWYHSPENKKWDISSYQLLYKFNTLDNFWQLYNNFTPPQIQYGMFFLMKDDIKPIWEDVNNISGGSWSFKISKKDTFSAWIELSISAIGETLSKDCEFLTNINGITISPKKNFSILKIWNKDKKLNDTSFLTLDIANIILEESLYNAHSDKN